MPDSIPTLKAPPKPSTTIAGVGYDPQKKVLAVRLMKQNKPGEKVYLYSGIEQPFVDKFLAADSMGKFFAENIAKPRLPFNTATAPTE